MEHHGKIVGFWCRSLIESQEATPGYLFIHPEHMRKGIARRLWQVVKKEAMDKGINSFTIEADPNAVPFYLDLGAQKAGEIESKVIPGRKIPLLKFILNEAPHQGNNGHTIPNQLPQIRSVQNATWFNWGNGCDGWWLKEDKNFTVISERMPPGTSEKRHYHKKTEQLFYCLSGTLLIELENQNYILNAHEGLTVPAGQKHKINNISGESSTFLVISGVNVKSGVWIH